MSDSAIMADVSESTEKFGVKLTRAVKRMPGSQRDLAAQVGVSPQMLQQYMRGSVPKTHTLFLLSKALNVDLAWLLNEDDDSLDSPPVGSEELTLKEASGLMISLELRNRYGQYAIMCDEALGHLETWPWEDVAIWVLWSAMYPVEVNDKSARNGPPVEVPGVVKRALTVARDIGRLFLECHRCNAGGNFPDGLFLCGVGLSGRSNIDPMRLQFSALMERREQFEEAHPGLKAINEFFFFVPQRFAEGLGEDIGTTDWIEERFQAFWSIRAPYILATLVNHKDIVKKPKFDVIRKQLKKAGYLDRKGKPVENIKCDLPFS